MVLPRKKKKGGGCVVEEASAMAQAKNVGPKDNCSSFPLLQS